MDLSMTIKPVAIERRGVPNPGAPVRSRAPIRAGWQALFDDRSKFLALIEKSKENNKNLMTRMSPSAQRKQRVAMDHWCHLLRLSEPDLGEERYWDIDIIETHGMYMVDFLVRTPTIYIYILIIIHLLVRDLQRHWQGGKRAHCRGHIA